MGVGPGARRAISRGLACVVLIAAVVMPANVAEATTPGLRLVAARDHLPGAFPGRHNVWADGENVYLAGVAVDRYRGGLFVIARNRPGYPLRQRIQVEGASPVAVVGDGNGVYSAWSDAHLRLYRRQGSRLVLQRDVALRTPYAVADLALSRRTLYIAQGGGGYVAANSNTVAGNLLNDSDTITVYGTNGRLRTVLIGFTFGATSFFDTSGTLRTQVPNPVDLQGTRAGGALVADPGGITMTGGGGCCGTGYQRVTTPGLRVRPFVSVAGANSAQQVGGDVVVGTEYGTVVRLDARTSDVITQFDLRTATGHEGIEDIEIRSVFVDGPYIFAASSWGNATSRNLTLPNFFVLRRT